MSRSFKMFDVSWCFTMFLSVSPFRMAKPIPCTPSNWPSIQVFPLCINLPQPVTKHSPNPNEAHFLTATTATTATRQQGVIQADQNRQKQGYSHRSLGGHMSICHRDDVWPEPYTKPGLSSTPLNVSLLKYPFDWIIIHQPNIFKFIHQDTSLAIIWKDVSSVPWLLDGAQWWTKLSILWLGKMFEHWDTVSTKPWVHQDI